MPLVPIDEGKLRGRMKQVNQAVHRGLLRAGARVQFRWIALMESERPGTFMTGQTIRTVSVSSVHTAFAGSGGGVIKFVTVGPRPEYAKWGIGSGRRPGTPPPFRYILAWVREKPGGSGLTDAQAWIRARGVQKSIARKGTKAYHIRERVMQLEGRNVSRILRLEISNTLRS